MSFSQLVLKMSAVPPSRGISDSSRERKRFPPHFGPDRLDGQQKQPGTPHLGPGCYDNEKFGTMVHELEKKPARKSARTAAHPPNKTVTPSPQQYQPDHSTSRVPPPGKAPFGSTTPRFQSTSSSADSSPGPGTYHVDVQTNKKVSWPMCFGSPDWSRVTQVERKSLEMSSDREFVKYRNRLAYLRLYF